MDSDVSLIETGLLKIIPGPDLAGGGPGAQLTCGH